MANRMGKRGKDGLGDDFKWLRENSDKWGFLFKDARDIDGGETVVSPAVSFTLMVEPRFLEERFGMRKMSHEMKMAFILGVQSFFFPPDTEVVDEVIDDE